MTSDQSRGRADGTSTEANDADLLEQAQPMMGEPASATADRMGAPTSPSGPESGSPTADEIEQRQDP